MQTLTHAEEVKLCSLLLSTETKGMARGLMDYVQVFVPFPV
jgi:hypothetical protein